MESTVEIITDVEGAVSFENNVDYSGCDVCGEDHDTDDCPMLSAGKKVQDTTAPSRARLTLPKTLQVRDLIDGTTTVLTKETISIGTQFGPFESPRTTEFNLVTRFQLKVFEKDGSFVFMDANDEKDCNWMCLVAMASTEEELNLIAYQMKQDIYFSAVKAITPGKELRVWYAPHYGKKMGISSPWERVGEVSVPKPIFDKQRKGRPSTGGYRRGRKRRRKTVKPKVRQTRYVEEEEEEEDEEDQQSRQEVVETLDPRRLGFKEMREWICSQCGDVFSSCLEFARHLSNHYKPRPPGAKRRDAGMKRPKNFPCEYCGQKFTSDRLRHRHKLRNHQRALRKLKKPHVVENSPNTRNRLKFSEGEFVTGEDGEPLEMERLLNVEITVLDLPSAGNVNDPTTIIINQRKMELSQVSEGEITLTPTKEEEGTEASKLGEVPSDENQTRPKKGATRGEDTEMASAAQTLESVIREIIAPEEPDGGSEDADSDDDTIETMERDTQPSEFEFSFQQDSSQQRGTKRRRRGNYECDICHKCFQKSIYLFRHIRKHTGDFTCLQCHKVFARKESMLKHHCPGLIGEGEFTCTECCKTYTSRDILLNHCCTKNPVSERYACEICHKTFTKLKYLDKHIPVHTGVFSCPICGKWLRSNDSLINHMRICGQVKELEANGTATCPHCKEEFNDLKVFRRHIFDHTHMFACENCGARFRNKLSLGLHVCNAERCITCDECGKEFNSIASLNRHRVSHGEPEYHCENCGRSYHRKEALLKHPCERAKRSKTRIDKKPPSLQPLICEICGSMFSSTSSLNVHKNLHGEKKFGCEVCGKRFHRKDLLLEHMAVHGQPEIPCPVCSKLFKTKKSLDVHLLIHDGIKRFKCPTCGKMFYQKGNLQKHEETHTPGRRHTCEHCNKAFSSKEYLTIHVLEHTRGRIFVCSACGRSFVKEHQLKAHKRVFHGNQAYVCKYCGLSVKLRHSLKRHLEKKHGSVRQEWEANEQIGDMLMKRVVLDENEEALEYQTEDAVITDVSPTQGAEVLLAVAGIGSAALQQAIAAGTARIQQGSTPNTIEISLPVGPDGLQDGMIPDGEETIIQHVVADQDGIMHEAGEPHQIHIVSAEGEDCIPQLVMEGEPGQEHTLSDGSAIVLENGTILQQTGENGNSTDLLLYVLTTSETQETQE